MMHRGPLFIFKDEFDRKAGLIFLGLVVFYLYFFRILLSPWIITILGLLVGLLSISLRQSFQNIVWSAAGSTFGAILIFAFTLFQSTLIGIRTPAGTIANVSRQSFVSADSIAVLSVLIAFYALWLIVSPAGYALRKIVLRR